MEHYDEYGNPTDEHIALVKEANDIAYRTLKGEYISGVEILFPMTGKKKNSVEMGVRIMGAAGKDGKWRVFATDKKVEGDLLSYVLDEISLELTEKFVAIPYGWSNFTISDRSVMETNGGIAFKCRVTRNAFKRCVTRSRGETT